MKNRYIRPLAVLALTALTGCATTQTNTYDLSRPKFVGRIDGVEGFVGTKEQVGRFADRHNLTVYDINEKECIAEGTTMSRHRYIAATSEALIDWNVLNGPSKATNAIKRQ